MKCWKALKYRGDFAFLLLLLLEQLAVVEGNLGNSLCDIVKKPKVDSAVHICGVFHSSSSLFSFLSCNR